MRRHYVTLCVHGNTVVTYARTADGVEVTFEQAKNKGFNTAVMDLDGGIISNDGFPPAETDYFRRFLCRNRAAIAEYATESPDFPHNAPDKAAGDTRRRSSTI